MKLAEVLVTPHTVDESLPVLRAVAPREASALEKQYNGAFVGPDLQAVAAASAKMTSFFRQAVQEQLQDISDATPRLAHESCRKLAVVAPRYRQHRDRMAFAKLRIARNADHIRKADKLDRERAAAVAPDESAERRQHSQPESPPLVDRHEPAALRGPPAPRPMPMHGTWATGYVRIEGQSSTATVRHTTASAWDLMKGGERT